MSRGAFKFDGAWTLGELQGKTPPRPPCGWWLRARYHASLSSGRAPAHRTAFNEGEDARAIIEFQGPSKSGIDLRSMPAESKEDAHAIPGQGSVLSWVKSLAQWQDGQKAPGRGPKVSFRPYAAHQNLFSCDSRSRIHFHAEDCPFVAFPPPALRRRSFPGAPRPGALRHLETPTPRVSVERQQVSPPFGKRRRRAKFRRRRPRRLPVLAETQVWSRGAEVGIDTTERIDLPRAAAPLPFSGSTPPASL